MTSRPPHPQDLIKAFEAWPEPVTPPFQSIEVIGCCDKHEKLGDFKWYREHTWQDFRDLILSDTVRLDSIIDTSDFCGLYPPVYRYFLKGVFLALINNLEDVEDFYSLTFYDAWSWIRKNKEDIERLNKTKKDFIVFSKEEVTNILELLNHICDKFLIYTPDEKDMAYTLEYWKKYLNILNRG